MEEKPVGGGREQERAMEFEPEQSTMIYMNEKVIMKCINLYMNCCE